MCVFVSVEVAENNFNTITKVCAAISDCLFGSGLMINFLFSINETQTYYLSSLTLTVVMFIGLCLAHLHCG